MKKLLPILLAACMLVAFASGCKSDPEPTTPAPAPGNASSAPASSAPAPASSAPASPAPVVPEAPVEGANLAEHIDVIGDSGALSVLNPFVAAGTGQNASLSYLLVADRLLEQPSPGVFEPQLATRWETDDYLTFRFYLRDDVYFHNGDHMTADDVVWTVQFAQAEPGTPAFNQWTSVKTVEAIDAYTVEFVLNSPNIDFYGEVSQTAADIYSKRAHDENPDDPSWAWIGTGPFRVTGFSTSDYISFERFEEHWSGPAPTKSLTLWTIPELSTRAIMMQTGAAQLSFYMPPEDLDLLDDSPDFTVHTAQPSHPGVLGFNNMGDAIMMDPYFRLAVAHAIDVDDLGVVAYGRWHVAPWDGNGWGSSTEYRMDGVFPRREHDIELAKEYLAQSVYNGETLSIVATLDAYPKAAELMQYQLAEAGIIVEVDVREIFDFVSSMSYNPDSDKQMHCFSGPGDPSVNAAMRYNLYPGTFSNWLNLNNDWLTGRIEALWASVDHAEREAIAHEIQEWIYEDIPFIALFWQLQGIPAVNGIGGIRLGPLTFLYDMRGIYWDLNETPEHLRP